MALSTLAAAAKADVKATGFLKRMTTRFTPSQTMKASLAPSLGLDPDTDIEKVALMCWLRAHSLPMQGQSAYWMMQNWSYIYLLIGEYLLGVDPPPAAEVDGCLATLWDDIKVNIRDRALVAPIAAIEADTTKPTAKDKILAALTSLAPLMVNVVGYNMELDLDSCVSVLAIAMSKRGTASDALCSRVQTEFQRENILRSDLAITSSTVKNVWELMGPFVTKNMLALIVEDSANAKVLRLRLLMQRIATTGLTAYRTIKEMAVKHPSFPWDELERIYPSEKQELDNIDAAIEKDPFLAYSGNANLYAVNKYSNLFYVARQIKIVVDRDNMFNQYVAHAPTNDTPSLDALVNLYKEKVVKINQDRFAAATARLQ